MENIKKVDHIVEVHLLNKFLKYYNKFLKKKK